MRYASGSWKKFLFVVVSAFALLPSTAVAEDARENSLWPGKSVGAQPYSRRATTAIQSNIIRRGRSCCAV